MQLTIGSFTGSTNSLGWMDACNIYILYQAYENNLKLKNSQPSKSQKGENILRTKLPAVKYLIQSFSIYQF